MPLKGSSHNGRSDYYKEKASLMNSFSQCRSIDKGISFSRQVYREMFL